MPWLVEEKLIDQPPNKTNSQFNLGIVLTIEWDWLISQQWTFMSVQQIPNFEVLHQIHLKFIFRLAGVKSRKTLGVKDYKIIPRW